MIITCTKGAVTIYPQTGITLPEGGEIPLVANPKGESYVLEEGETYDTANKGQPAIGGKFRAGSSAFTVTNDTDGDVTIVRWFEVDNDPIYMDEMMSYKDESGLHTDDNMTKHCLAPKETYETDVVTSNVLTVSVMPILVTIQPI